MYLGSPKFCNFYRCKLGEEWKIALCVLILMHIGQKKKNFLFFYVTFSQNPSLV